MDINNSMANSGGWNCQRCGEKNANEDAFCVKCGGGRFASNGTKAKRSKGKWIIFILLGLALIAAILGGSYYWSVQNQQKVAVNYLENESKAFGNSVSLVNTLSTEKAIENTDQNDDLFVKKLEEERNNAEKALNETTATKEKNSKASTNKLVVTVDALLKQYYADASTQLDTYNKYISYKTDLAREDVAFQQDISKLDTIFKNAKSLDDVSNSLKALQNSLAGAIDKYNSITPPAGLEDAHGKGVALVQKLNSIFSEMTSAIDAKDKDKLLKADSDLRDFMSNEKAFKEITQLEDYYFDQLHNKFINLRKTADNAKSEITKVSATMNVQTVSINIEGW
jgi:flagellar basal body-associated protein FliL